MKATVILANGAWLAASAVAEVKFRRALREPAAAQWQRLQSQLQRNARSAFGRAHGFADIRSYRDYVERVPIMDPDELEPWVRRIRRGETAVLTTEPVLRLLPTSGSTQARKLIPFTTGLQNEFNAAIAPWFVDLCRQFPGCTAGPAYWSVTPAAAMVAGNASVVPIGFDDDSRHLGGARARLIAATMAVPSAVRHIQRMDDFRYVVLLCLLRQPGLRFVSVWHPSFLSLLLSALPEYWPALLDDVKLGTCRIVSELPLQLRDAVVSAPRPGLAAALAAADPNDAQTIWRRLAVVSCWADGQAVTAAAGLQRRLPRVVIQPKGLLATEAFISLPFRGAHPVAVRSHFYEFAGADGRVHPVEDLRPGGTYEVIVSTAGGLWRYRLGDRVEVDGFVERTPSLRFVGRAGAVVDICGEKLSEAFAGSVIHSVTAASGPPVMFSMLAPEEVDGGWRYTLYLEGDCTPDLATRLDAGLRANPHYAWCRELGQLRMPAVFSIGSDAYARYAAAEVARGRRLGDIKPIALSPRSDWSRHFSPR